TILFLITGLLVGFSSGIVGVGGGVFVIPILVFLFGFSQKMAQGTSLAMLLPPVGILAVMEYYKSGNIDVKVAILLSLGYLFGAYFGSSLAVTLSNDMLKKIFGLLLLGVSLKMLIGK
ncbi:MAG: sulfite exporter TauE/SafE family protein, partial [Ignavibacteriales bacterium]|nr:sulfite exporter TauE/SafE family protein [Ignavibacteriales bacterium]